MELSPLLDGLTLIGVVSHIIYFSHWSGRHVQRLDEHERRLNSHEKALQGGKN